MIGDIATTTLAPTHLDCATCGRNLAACTCTADELAASCRLDVRGSLIDGVAAREFVVSGSHRRCPACGGTGKQPAQTDAPERTPWEYRVWPVQP